ncbi:MAG: IS66 family insertion sequence element accessory protein TnpB [Burkholderiaceae bacterium]
MIRVDAWWLAVQPLDMRVGTEGRTGSRGAGLWSGAPHHAYLFANRRANRMKVLVHDGIGVWLAARRLNIGKFAWANDVVSTPRYLARSLTRWCWACRGNGWAMQGSSG